MHRIVLAQRVVIGKRVVDEVGRQALRSKLSAAAFAASGSKRRQAKVAVRVVLSMIGRVPLPRATQEDRDPLVKACPTLAVGAAVAPPRVFRHVRAMQRRFTGADLRRAGMARNVEADERKAERASGDAAPLKLEDFLPYRLNVVASLASQALSRIYADRYGIGVPEWRILVTLGQFDTMTGKQIGAHSHMHKTKVSRAVAQLEARALLARRANRADRREAFLSLTPAGRAIYEDLAPTALQFVRRLSEAIEPSDRAAFERALKRLTERSALLAAEAASAVSQTAPGRTPALPHRAS